MEQLQPDLLLTDIQMPFITGTELAKSVRELQPLISIAFLSGYDDFEYAQRAIENRVISYLLKPISVAELTAALREIHVKMERNFQELRPVDVHVSKHLTTASLLLDPYAEYSGEDASACFWKAGWFLPGLTTLLFFPSDFIRRINAPHI